MIQKQLERKKKQVGRKLNHRNWQLNHNNNNIEKKKKDSQISCLHDGQSSVSVYAPQFLIMFIQILVSSN